jgi:serine/threonine protein kinase/tetratricopeptide (TPR) repeat protein
VLANRYEILALVGEGGMGRVYAARDRAIDKVIALKTIRVGEEDEGARAVHRFKQELLLARKVTHRNVVRIYDLGEAEGIKFFTMEYIEGKSLKALITERGKLPTDEAVNLARQILAGLAEAHAQGITHRDLKPQNVMVDNAGVAHIMDFGIARSADTAGVTGTGQIVGTPDYMSPEQVRGEHADARSDIFSFGVILYEMLTGDVPYQAENPVSRIVMRLTHKPRAPRELSADIPPYLEGTILKCMELELESRYQTVGAILADLERQQVPTRVASYRFKRLKGWKGPVAAAAVLALGAVGGSFWARGRSPEQKGAAVPEGQVRTLAIVPFTNATGSAELEWMRTGLPEMLVTDLSQSLYIRPISGERVSRVLQETGLAQQSRFDETALESVSKLAHAESVLFGQYVESGGRLRLDLKLRKAGSGVPIPLKVEGTPAEVFALVDQITRRIKEHLDLSQEQIAGDTDRPITEVSTASIEAQRAYQDGLARLRQEANQDAIALLEKACAKDPNFAMAFSKLAEARLNAGLHEEAAAAADRARSLSDKEPLPLATRYQIHATAALVKEDYGTAAESYGELAKLYPADPDVALSLARAFEEAGKLPEALEAYQRLVKAEPRYGAALLGLGRVQVGSGHADEAVRSLQDALATKQFESEPEALGMIYSILGVAYRDTSQLDKAMEALNLSFDYRVKTGDKRGQAVTLSNLASVYEFRGEIDRALAAESKALGLARELGDRAEESFSLYSMGLTYKVAGRLDKALAAFRESLHIEEERKDHHRLAHRLDKIADVYRLMGQYDDAIVYLEQAKAHLAKTSEREEKAINLNYFALVRKSQGFYTQAIEAYLASLPIFKEIEQDMGVAMTHHNLAEIYAAQGRYADARSALDQSLGIYEKLKVVHDVAEVRAPLGHLLATLGRVDEAERELAEAERLAKESKAEGLMPEIMLGKAEVAHLRGRDDEAAALFEQANVKANLSNQKEVAVESRIELGLLYLHQGKLVNAERLLLRTRAEAEKARLRLLEAQAAAALAEVFLAKRDAEAARRQAQDAIRIADKLEARPVLHSAQASLGEALDMLGRGSEALDAHAKAVALLEWMRGSLRPEDAGPFMSRPDVQAFLQTAVPKLEKGGRGGEAAPLKSWVRAAPTARAATKP